MKARFLSLLLPLLVLTFAQTVCAKTPSETLALKAVSENSLESGPAIAELRAMGPAGMQLLLQTYADEIRTQVTNPLQPATPEWLRLSAALDAVSRQKNSYLSGLYWYTDFEQAKAAARASGKPILSLHLLGNLDEEFSCANSRFFRTVLYANAGISKVLREQFILHWQSERPAPRVTIDYGDGRKLERTLTGNSIHYVLDTNGKVVDALPGLYGPAAFLRALNQMKTVAEGRDESRLATVPIPYPRARLNAINVAWYQDIQKTGGKIPVGLLFVEQNRYGTPTAIQAASFAMTKAVTERSILRSVADVPVTLGTITDQETWNKIAQLHLADAKLDANSLGLIRRQIQPLMSDGSGKDTTFLALVRKLEQNIALDTVRNEYLMHTTFYAWLLADPERDVNKLNQRVYSELFLTPASDPWLGMYSADVYTALDGGGISRK
jgi:hypothetical protein